MRKFNTYNGFHTKTCPKLKYSPMSTTQSSQQDNVYNTQSTVEIPLCDSTNIKRDLANHMVNSTAINNTDQKDADKNISHDTTSSQPIFHNIGEDNDSEYTYTHTEELYQPISMKTRRLMQLSRTHERAIEAIIAASNNEDYSPKIH